MEGFRVPAAQYPPVAPTMLDRGRGIAGRAFVGLKVPRLPENTGLLGLRQRGAASVCDRLDDPHRFRLQQPRRHERGQDPGAMPTALGQLENLVFASFLKRRKLFDGQINGPSTGEFNGA